MAESKKNSPDIGAEGFRDLPKTRPDPWHGYYQYETIEFDGRLEILDRHGRVARFSRRQRLRFLEDGVCVFIDRVWGDGVLFAGYHARSMRILDAIRTRKGCALLLSLPKPFRKGDTFDVITERRIVGAFIDRHAYWELSMPAPTQFVSLDVCVPRGRRCAESRIVAPPRGEFHLRQGTDILEFSLRQPAVDIPYRLEWSWR